MGQPILVGYDPRTKDRAPVHLGVVLARVTEAPLIVALVQAPAGPRALGITPPQELPYAIVQPDPDLLHDCAPQVEEIKLELETYGIQAGCEVLIGTRAAKSLHEAAEERRAGLLVVGSSRRGARGRVLAGATAARLLPGRRVLLRWHRTAGSAMSSRRPSASPSATPRTAARPCVERSLSRVARTRACARSRWSRRARGSPRVGHVPSRPGAVRTTSGGEGAAPA